MMVLHHPNDLDLDLDLDLDPDLDLDFRHNDHWLNDIQQVNRWRLNPIANPLIELLTGIKILIVKSKMAAV